MSRKSDSQTGAEIGKILQVVVGLITTGLTALFIKKSRDKKKNEK